MSSRVSYAVAIVILLAAAVMRLYNLSILPAGLHADEINDIRIAETVRQGQVEVFYDLDGEGREGLYHVMLAATTGFVGDGLMGYRVLSVWVGLLTVSTVYAIGLRLFNPLVGLAAMSVMAFSFWHVLLSRQVGQNIFVPLLVSLTLLTLINAFSLNREGNLHLSGTAYFTLLGALLGFTLYVHPFGFDLILFSAVFVVFMLLTRRDKLQGSASQLIFTVMVALIISIPYIISSLRLPELSGTQRFLGDYSLTNDPTFTTIFRSVGGLLLAGDRNPVHNLPGRPLYDPATTIFLVVGLYTVVRFRRQPRCAMLVLASVMGLPVALLSADSPNFSAYIGLLPTLALIAGVGVSAVYVSMPRASRRAAMVALLGLVLLNIFWTSRDLFGFYPDRRDVRAAHNTPIAQLAHYIDTTSDDIPTLMCTDDLDPSEPLPVLSNRRLIALMMHRENPSIRYADCGTALVLMNGGEPQQIILARRPTDNGDLHPAVRFWLDQGVPLQRPDLPPDAVLYLDVQEELANVIGRFTTTVPVNYPPEAPGENPTAQLPISFGGNITFLGYEASTRSDYRPGDIVTAITYWRVDGEVPPDLRLFTHLLPDPNTISSQNDIISVATESLQPRDIFMQITFVPVPFTIPAGVHRVSIGAYQDTDNQRLNVLENNEPRGTRLFLNQINITPEPDE